MKPNVKSPLAARIMKSIASPVERFMHLEAASGLVLMFCAIVAMIWANSSFYESYEHFIHLPIKFSLANFEIEKSLSHWVNDGLMVIFFYVVGMEIKREVMSGELSSLKKAALPIFAAIGGMIFPALIYVAINYNHPENLSGWGIPMATDIAFVIGILALFSKRIPFTLKIILLALAIADDLGAVLVIALFYTDQIFYASLFTAILSLFAILVLRFAGIQKRPIYVILSVITWFAVLKSGVHATIAGVLLGFLVPMDSGYDKPSLFKKINSLMGKIHINHDSLSKTEEKTFKEVTYYARQSMSPLDESINRLHIYVGFIIMPLFALVNAGVHLGDTQFSDILNSPISLGVIFGLLIGKPLGVVFFSWLSIKLKLAVLPKSLSWFHIFIAGALAGIGFTMALFVSGLALPGEHVQAFSKLGILLASVLSGTIGVILILMPQTTKK